jgi:hypothetical protein
MEIEPMVFLQLKSTQWEISSTGSKVHKQYNELENIL